MNGPHPSPRWQPSAPYFPPLGPTVAPVQWPPNYISRAYNVGHINHPSPSVPAHQPLASHRQLSLKVQHFDHPESVHPQFDGPESLHSEEGLHRTQPFRTRETSDALDAHQPLHRTLPFHAKSRAHALRKPVSMSTVVWVNVVVPLFIVLTFCLIVISLSFILGPIFIPLEEGNRRALRDEAILGFWAQNFTAEQVEALEAELLFNDSPFQWTVLNSAYFTLTMLTTIGYGDLVPRTCEGRVVAFFISLLLSPIITTILIYSGHYFVQFVIGSIFVVRALVLRTPCVHTVFDAKVEEILEDQDWTKPLYVKGVRRILEYLDDRDGELTWLDVCLFMDHADRNQAAFCSRTTLHRALHTWGRKRLWDRQLESPRILLVIAIAVFVWVLVGGASFQALEGWRYGDSVYFCFITLTTIGYGDFAPATAGGRIWWFAYVTIGVGIMFLLLISLSNILVALGKTFVTDRPPWTLHHDFESGGSSPSAAYREHRVALRCVRGLVFVTAYVCLGGLMFSVSEDNVQQLQNRVEDYRYASLNFTDAQMDYLHRFLQLNTTWHWADATRFAFASITTVGYGNIVPRTSMGQSLVVIYALCGVGCVALFLSQIADACYAATLVFCNYVLWLAGCRPLLTEQSFLQQAETMLRDLSTKDQMTVAEAIALGDRLELRTKPWRKLVLEVDDGDGHLDSNELMTLMGRFLRQRLHALQLIQLAINAFMVGVLALSFAGLFVATEGWHYGEALWFTWVTAATIGFGDYIPGYEDNQRHRDRDYDVGTAMNLLYMVLNLGFLANCITAAHPLVTYLLIHAQAKLQYSCSSLRKA